MKHDEVVLCSARSDLSSAWLPQNGAVFLSESEWADALSFSKPHWLRRGAAENDPLFKQWIPYVLIIDANSRLAVYRRKGSETRLHGCFSIGIGGHVNQNDSAAEVPSDRWWHATITAGMRRELSEELPAAAAGNTQFLGIINEDTGPVGRVHIGAVFLHRIEEAADADSDEISGLAWVPMQQLGSATWPAKSFETWSLLALQLFNRFAP